MKKVLRAIGYLLGSLAPLVILMIIAYNVVVFAQIPVAVGLRNMWIETAMTTGSHQWMATSLFPERVVDATMERFEVQVDVQSDPSSVQSFKRSDVEEFTDIDQAVEVEPVPEYVPKLPTVAFTEADGTMLDALGNKVIVDDAYEGIRIVRVSGETFTGHLMFIADPSRLAISAIKDSTAGGQRLNSLVEQVGGIAGINANGFSDPEGIGGGGTIIGWTVSEGEAWGYGPKEQFISAGFDIENRLIVGNLKDFEQYEIRDLSQWQPALIVDGVQKVTGSAGWGLQPRTAIAQTLEGVVILAVIDGRQPGYSVGISVGELADILFEYGAYNAALCDGGASSIMSYKGENVGRVCTRNEAGRRIPNAWVVKPRE